MKLPPLLLIDKPVGMTSFDVIRVLRQHTGVRKFGHAGTLDPLASGLMLVGAEAGTKQLASLIKLDKVYEATIRVGEKRSTGDLEGAVLETRALTKPLCTDVIECALTQLVGAHEYPVSAYSAIKKDGVPMYKRARAAEKKGELVTEVPVRTMTVYEAVCLGHDPVLHDGVHMERVRVRFSVASGTYIRSLAEAFGTILGYPATLEALRRTQVGDYRVGDAVLPDVYKKELL